MKTKESRVPGFNAEAVFDGTGHHYRLTGGRADAGEQVVLPQLPMWFDCPVAAAVAAATCEATAGAGPVGRAVCAAATAAVAANCD
jgi:hypothetical protein